MSASSLTQNIYTCYLSKQFNTNYNSRFLLLNRFPCTIIIYLLLFSGQVNIYSNNENISEIPATISLLRASLTFYWLALSCASPYCPNDSEKLCVLSPDTRRTCDGSRRRVARELVPIARRVVIPPSDLTTRLSALSKNLFRHL